MVEFQLTVMELALLIFEVHDYNMPENGGFSGQICLPVAELRQGIVLFLCMIAKAIIDIDYLQFHCLCGFSLFKYRVSFFLL